MERQRRNVLTVGAIGFAILLFGILGIIQTQKSHNMVAFAKDIPGPQGGYRRLGELLNWLITRGRFGRIRTLRASPCWCILAIPIVLIFVLPLFTT